MKKFSFFFTVFLLSLAAVDIKAEETNTEENETEGTTNTEVSQQTEGTTPTNLAGKASNASVNEGSEGGMSAGNADKNSIPAFENKFFHSFSGEEEVTQEEIEKNRSILNESVKKNQSGFWGSVVTFFEVNYDMIVGNDNNRIVDFFWYKSKMEHEDNEEYKANKNKIEKYYIKKAFMKLIGKYLEGRRYIDEETTHRFYDEYDKIKDMVCSLDGEDSNNFGENALRLITLEKIFGDRGKGFHDLLSSLRDVPEDTIEELQTLFADLKINEEEFVKCFTDMSAVEKYNLEKDAWYDKKGNENYCESQWLKVDKEGFHETTKGFLTWGRVVLTIFIALNIIKMFKDLLFGNEEKQGILELIPKISERELRDTDAMIMETHFIFSLFRLPRHIIVGDDFFYTRVTLCIISLITYFLHIILSSLSNKRITTFLIILIRLIRLISIGFIFIRDIIEMYIRLSNLVTFKINKNLAFLINRKFKYIKNYIETLKKIYIVIKENDVLARTFGKELVSLENTFGNEASEETKHLLNEIDKQKLYDSFNDVEDTGETMFLFDKNKDIFSKCIVDVNKINACVRILAKRKNFENK